MPVGLVAVLTGHQVFTRPMMGWEGLANGELLKAAEQDGFDLMVTADQNIQYQQNLAGRRIALVVLSTNFWPTIRANAEAVQAAVRAAETGSYTAVSLERPPLRRRPYYPPPT